MKNFKANNPALQNTRFIRASEYDTSNSPMTISGVIFKTSILLSLLVFSGALSWGLISYGYGQIATALSGISLIVGLILGFYTIFRPNHANITAPIYAIVEGFLLGTVSFAFEHVANGIVSSAILLTLATLTGMLLLYKTNIIKVNQTFMAVLFSLMSGILIVYSLNAISWLFGSNFSLFTGSTGPSIIFSFIVVAVAALNLVLDFEFINQAVESGVATKKAEWYAGFSIMLTLVWLYLEILKLLSKLSRRD